LISYENIIKALVVDKYHIAPDSRDLPLGIYC